MTGIALCTTEKTTLSGSSSSSSSSRNFRGQSVIRNYFVRLRWFGSEPWKGKLGQPPTSQSARLTSCHVLFKTHRGQTDRPTDTINSTHRRRARFQCRLQRTHWLARVPNGQVATRQFDKCMHPVCMLSNLSKGTVQRRNRVCVYVCVCVVSAVCISRNYQRRSKRNQSRLYKLAAFGIERGLSCIAMCRAKPNKTSVARSNSCCCCCCS
jgi:hypothetical protein